MPTLRYITAWFIIVLADAFIAMSIAAYIYPLFGLASTVKTPAATGLIIGLVTLSVGMMFCWPKFPPRSIVLGRRRCRFVWRLVLSF